MSLFDNSNLVFGIFAILLFIVLVLVYMMFGPLPNQTKFLSDNVNENITIVGLLDLQSDTQRNNVVIGNNASVSINDSGSTATQNTIVGVGSSTSLKTGNNNTNVGYGSGQLSNGNDNTFIGNETGFHNTGNDNTFMGSNAGNKNTSGFQNTHIGSRAGERNNGHGNIFLGFNAGDAVTNAINSFYISNNIDSVAGTGTVAGSTTIPLNLPANYVMLAYNTVTGQIAPITTP
jgi:hypothetical protein